MSLLPDAARWQRLDAALRTLLDLDEAARADWISVHCTDDEATACELRQLLACAGCSGTLEQVERPTTLIDAIDALPGNPGRVGTWTLLHRIGAGGMAEVVLAERDNGGVTQRAALKLMARGLGSADLRARFLRERDILARLTDARIARYVDGGISDDDRPWLAMEPVDGLPIDRHCSEHALGLRERLALFREVCGAVAHAHRQLVVHRDIKPSNVMVSRDGQVKLLDFGIAKALVADDDSATRSSERVLTPRYASPEQLRGATTSTGTDVFLLGLLLYELLAGQRPFAAHEDDPFALERALREDDPPAPGEALARRLRGGDAATPGLTPRMLRGDLDRIVLCALRKDPAQRYSSVERLDEDIARFLHGDAIAARGDAFGYRLRKWLARHRYAAAAAAGALLVSLVYAGLLLRQNHLLSEQRDHARASAAQAAAVKDFLLELFNEADPAKTLGEKLSVGSVLERGSARINEGFAQQPRVRAEMLHAIGSAYHALGNHARARGLLERAVALRRQWPDASADLARSLTALAAVERDASQLDLGLALAREAVARSGDDVHARALALNELGVGLLMRDQDLDEARSALGAALAAYRTWPAQDLVRTAIATGNLAAIDLGEGKLEAAEAGFRSALATLAPRLGDTHPEVTALLYNLARLAERGGRLDEAAALFERVLAAETKVLGTAHADVAIDRTRLAYVQAAQGRLDTAAQNFSIALAGLRAALPDDHKRIAENLMGYAETLLEQQQAAQAETAIREAIGILGRHFADDDWRMAEARRVLARVLHQRGRTDAGRELLARVGPVLLAQPAPYPLRYRTTLAELDAPR